MCPKRKWTFKTVYQWNILLYSKLKCARAIYFFKQATGTYRFKDTGQIREIDAYVVLVSSKLDPRQARDIPSGRSTRMIFLDSGATICLGGLKHLLNIGLTTNNLIPSSKVIRAVGGSTLMCQGWLPVEFIIHRKTTKQALYIRQKIQRLYFSKAACIDIGILLPKDFPNTTATIPPIADMAMQYIPLTSRHKKSDACLKQQQSCFPFLVLCPKPLHQIQLPIEPIHPVPQTMETRITSSHPTSNTRQPSTLTRKRGIVQITPTQPASQV